ncbi:hypothetical protein [Lysobacter gummosus]|uniref:hypothetical protein n=1 Tax=Lysobacter gummosus TaxID=262324 RepID=UPI0036403536
MTSRVDGHHARRTRLRGACGGRTSVRCAAAPSSAMDQSSIMPRRAATVTA